MGNVYIPRRYYKKETIYNYTMTDKQWDMTNTGSVIGTIDTKGKLWVTGKGKPLDVNDTANGVWRFWKTDSSYLNKITTFYIDPNVDFSSSNMSYWFAYSSKLNTVGKLPSSATIFNSAFTNCEGLMDISNVKIPENAIDTRYMFDYCRNLYNFGNIVVPEKVDNCKRMFSSCLKATGTVTFMGNPTIYEECFAATGMNANSYIKVNYSKKCTNIDAIINTQGANGKVTKGVCIDA